MFDFRTDLTDERRDIYRKANKLEDEIPGIEVENYIEGEDIKVSKVKIVSEEGERAIGKPIGTYVTIDIKNLKIAQDEEIQKASEVVTKELKQLLERHGSSKDDVLVVGLGNIYVTPDSLGPKVINEIDITRHLLNYTTRDIKSGNDKTSKCSFSRSFRNNRNRNLGGYKRDSREY